MRSAEATRVVYRSKWVSAMYAGFALFLAVTGAAFVWQPEEPHMAVGLRLLGLVFLGVASFVGAQAVWVGLIVTPSEVIARTLFRTRKLRWVQIKGFTADTEYGALQWTVLRVQTRDGGAFSIPEIASPFWVRTGRDFPTLAAAELNVRLAESRNS